MPHDKPNGKEKSAFERISCDISAWVSDVAANPFAQLGVIVICVSWFAIGLDTGVLTAVLSIMAISLTQMVLSRQNEREAQAHRRDVAMHAKLDELVLASRLARDEMAGIEDLEEDQIEHLKEEARDAIHAADDKDAGPAERDAAKKAIDAADRGIKAHSDSKTAPTKRAASAKK